MSPPATLKQLEALIAIARAGTVARAAERLNTTQSAVSKRLRELETNLGFAAFERTGQGMKLTALGEELFIVAEEVLAAARNISLVGTGRLNLPVELRIGVTELAGITWLPDFLRELSSSSVNYQVGVEIEASRRLLDLLREDELDIVIAPEAGMMHDLRSEMVATVAMGLAAHPELVPHDGVLDREALAQQTFIYHGRRAAGAISQSPLLALMAPGAHRHIAAPSLLAMIGLTLSGMGVGYLPRDCFQGLSRDGRIRWISTTLPVPDTTYAIYSSSAGPTDLREDVIEALKRTVDYSRPLPL